MMTFAQAFLQANIIGFCAAFVCHLIFNIIQRKNNVIFVRFGAVMLWGLILSGIVLIYYLFR